MQLYIGGVRDTTKEKDIYDHFSKYGKVEHVKLYKNYGFISVEKEIGEKILTENNPVVNGDNLVIEVAKGRKMERLNHNRMTPPMYNPRYGSMLPPRGVVRKPMRLILENLPKNLDLSELKSFVLMSGARPDFIKILPSGDALLEFTYRRDRDWAIEQLNNQVLYGEKLIARLGRKKTESSGEIPAEGEQMQVE
ncbi:serine/arginine-rich splicing factor 4/5/6 [Nematocida sp. LUAm3]|nr:serine/arginine-rich splicing factor 4/5/6 [Nematocida sp. LUAm3]KAI5173703.1 serine/arginine-rich splicing factor 4/5/6 [Nematocida sp. LUAm2]KAI5176925.1 serine/arginine-rich splicing factor 4/5/6 [Nematocida sp. LUAm1]